jgi:hypothetical protein
MLHTFHQLDADKAIVAARVGRTLLSAAFDFGLEESIVIV